MTTPRTAAGRALATERDACLGIQCSHASDDDILAIEAEARAAAIREHDAICANRLERVAAEARAAYTDPQDRWRLVRVQPDVLAEWGTRTEDGDRLTVEWGEPDDDGIYDPTFTRHSEGNLRAEARAAALDGPELRELRDAADETWAMMASVGFTDMDRHVVALRLGKALAAIDALRERRGE